MTKRILISAGESSGDLHASILIRELKKINPNLEFFGLGCDKMEKEGVRLLERMDSLSIVGVWEIVAKLKFIKNLFKKLADEVSKEKADLAVLIDYPGFNLILARMLKSRGIPCVYYITPQFWAWGTWRIIFFKRYIKKAITILKFEEDFLKERGIDAAFVGHPLLDEHLELFACGDAKSAFGLNPDKFVIALLPGSRDLEVKRMLPVMIETARFLKGAKDVQFIISQSPNVDKKIFEDNIPKDFDAPLVKGDIYKVLCAADFALTSSGTITLQLAIAEKPMLITYITSLSTYILAKIFVKTADIGLVNIIAKKTIVPEILQHKAKPRRLADEILRIISSPSEMMSMESDLRKVKQSLGTSGASKRAAEIINNFLNPHTNFRIK